MPIRSGTSSDGFFYDVLRRPDGSFEKFRVRSLVGLVPLFAVERLEQAWIEPFGEFRRNLDWFLANRRDLVDGVVHTVNHDGRVTHVLTIVNDAQLVRILERVWDPDEFLSDYGIRSLSQSHEAQPFVFGSAGCRLRAGGSHHQDQGRKLELAGSDLVSDLLSADRVAAQAGQGLRQRSAPGRIGLARAADRVSAKWRGHWPSG